MNLQQALSSRDNQNKILSDACKRSFYTFFQVFWHVLESDILQDSWYIKEECELAEKIVRRIIKREPAEFLYYTVNVPPGSSKSSIWSRMLPAWCWAMSPSFRLITSSYSEDIALENAEKSQTILESDLFAELFPDIQIFGTKTRLRTHKNGVRYVSATKGKATGRHVDLILVDDPENTKVAESDAERLTSTNFVTKTLSTRKRNQKVTPTVVIQQRLHEKDSTGVIEQLQKEGIPVYKFCLPAEVSDKVFPVELKDKYVNGLLDPDRFDKTVLAAHKIILGSYAYAGQFGQTPAPLEGGIFKRDWFTKITKKDFLDRVKQARIDEKLIDHSIFCDPAYTKEDGNDPSGLTRYIYMEKTLYVLYHQSVHFEFPQLVQACVEWVNEEHEAITEDSILRIEPKASGLSLKQTLKAEPHFLNCTLSATPFKDKITRANSSTPFCESGRVVLVEGYWNQSWIDSICTFPNAEHDEEVDNLTAAIKYYKNKAVWAL